MTTELNQNVTTGAPASSWKPYPAYKDSGVEWLGEVAEQGKNAKVIFQTGLTGSTGYVLSFNPVHPVILLIASERKKRKAEHHKSLSLYTINRPGTRMTRIKRISTDNPIRAYPRHPRNPRSVGLEPDKKIRNQRHFSSITEQEAAR